MPSTSLVVSRTWGGPRGWSPGDWQVVLDGKALGSIAKGETTEFYIEPGPHTLRVRSKTHLSKERSFDVAEGHSVTFEAHEPRVGLTVIRALFNPELWITLKQE